MKNFLRQGIRLTLGYLQTALILLIFFFLVYYTHAVRGNSPQANIIISVIAFSLLVDGIYLALHLYRRGVKHNNLSFDPTKLTVVIACYNGEEVIGETIKNALVHVPPNQIIVVSDASTDNTVETAKSYGVRVIENERNLNKAFSISFVMEHVRTPYVLILDDDTLIGKTFIPTSLLDEGYDAVAFNVMPIPTGTLVNKLQTFEYRKSMFMGKSLRGTVGAVGNVSGAIGLYRTSDLVEQVTMHSGQFGGEDQQRTAFVHLHGKGKGVTYTEATVWTKAPDTVRQLFKQRSFRWNLSLPELFFVYWKILFSPRFHYLLKTEKAYQMYLLVTDPGRMLFLGASLFFPIQSFVIYLCYVALSSLVWMKTGRKDPFWILFVFPLYRSFESVCRYIAHFYWFKIKYKYVFEKQFHRLVPQRNLLVEYAGVVIMLSLLWVYSIGRFVNAAVNDKSSTEVFAADYAIEDRYKYFPIPVSRGDDKYKIARKALIQYTTENNLALMSEDARFAEAMIAAEEIPQESIVEGQIVDIKKKAVSEYIEYAIVENHPQ